MLLLSHLASLEHYDTLADAPTDRVLLRWEALAVDHQASANAYRLFTGKALSDRIDAAPHGTAKDVVADWVAKTERGRSTWMERKRVGKRFFELLEKHAERSKDLDLSILDCAFTEILPRLEAALGIETEADDDPPDERGPWRLVGAMLEKLVSMVGEGRPARERLAAMLSALAAQLLASDEDEDEPEPVDDEPTLASPARTAPDLRPRHEVEVEVEVEVEPEVEVEVEVEIEPDDARVMRAAGQASPRAARVEPEVEPERTRGRGRGRGRGRTRTPSSSPTPPRPDPADP